MLHQKLLQQRIRQPFVNLRLRSAFGAQEVARVQPGSLQPLLFQHGGHQACRPDFTVADHFRVNRFGNAAVQQRRKTLQIVNKSADQPVRHLRGQQAGNQITLITA
ncbi:hypothetical protein D3C78_1563510 [compost metagenome]